MAAAGAKPAAENASCHADTMARPSRGVYVWDILSSFVPLQRPSDSLFMSGTCTGGFPFLAPQLHFNSKGVVQEACPPGPVAYMRKGLKIRNPLGLVENRQL